MPDYPDYTLPIVVIGTVTVTGTVAISGPVTVTGSVGITGTVTVSGAVTVSGPVTISTVAADNIIIDKLTVGAYTERRTTLSNNGTTASFSPCSGVYRYGKFFPRGCRGFISTVDVHCQDAGSSGGTITVYLKPFVGGGYIYSASITVPAGGNADWRSATFNTMWEYDSMFIFVFTSSDDIQVGLDSGTPYDYYLSSDSGSTWGIQPFRFWFRVALQGATAGDVPVSGTVNAIMIPSIASASQLAATVPIGQNEEAYVTVAEGLGELLIAIFCIFSDYQRDNMRLRIKCDGQQALPIDDVISMWQKYYITTTTPGLTIGVYDPAIPYYTLIVTIPFAFRQKLEVGYYNAGATTTVGMVAVAFRRSA
jgi:hypothetical protein